jgi:RHS repeat-associated protein
MQNRFDPWGNYVVRDFTPFFPNVPITFRGFTGHEHYPELKIINMNGRLYDPVIARFFSPDNFVQDAEFTQSFNRYSYCLNNPLKYTDPEGERWMDVDDWYLNLESGRIVHREGSKNRFNEGLIHLASDNATVGNIEKALTEKNYQFIKAAVEGGFMVDTEKQYKGWAMMQIFNPEVVGMILSMGVPNMNNLATKGTQTIPHATKNSATLLKEVQVTAKAEMQGMRSFTSSNFRFNLGKLTGEIPANSQAHHIFPQKFATRFADRGINIHHPKFGAWWETTNHLQNVKAYNAAWEEFFISNPTPTQILNKGRDMLQLYGLPVGY